MRSRPGPGCSSPRSRASRERCSRSSRARSASVTRRSRRGGSAARGPRDRGLDDASPPALALAARIDAVRRRGRGDGGRLPRRPRLGGARRRRVHCCAVLPRRTGFVWTVAGLRDADEPRIMSLLLVTGAAGMFVGAQGVSPARPVRRHDARSRACVRRRQRAQPRARRGHRPADGEKRTEKRPVAAGRVPPSRALEFGLVLSALSFALLASTVNVLTATLALVGNLFYVLVYTRWLKRSTPQNIVIGGAAGAVPPLVGYAAADGNLGLPASLLALLDRLPLDAAALLGARAPDQGRLRERRRADAPGRARRAGDDAPDRPLLDRSRRLHARRRPLARAGSTRSPPPCSAARSSLSRGSSGATRLHGGRRSLLPLLARLPGAALRRGGRESGAAVKELTPELERKNLLLGWALFGISCSSSPAPSASRSSTSRSTDDLPRSAGVARTGHPARRQ